VNASASDLETDARINLYTIPKEQVVEEAGLLFYYNPFIHLPAGGEGTARMRCPVSKDISIVNVQSHMHRRGMNFVADLTDGSGAKIEELYTNTEWEEVPVKKFEPLFKVKAGQAIDYRCDYQNPESHEVNQGPTTKDEMCMLLGAYYPRDENLETCRDDTGFLNATWIGNGTADGAASVACFVGAKSSGEYFGCVVDSCPAIGSELTDYVLCQFSGGFGACGKECSGPDTSMCGTCIETACKPQTDAINAATCQ
jgi:hypothetical protein